MAKTERTESLANKNGTTFKVGDGVHWGFNADADPGTVRKVSASGRQVWVSIDEMIVTDKEREDVEAYGLHEGPIDCNFVQKDVPESEWTCWTLRADGRFTRDPGRNSISLYPTRLFKRNPSF